jgi:hypothetical protein
MNRRVVDLVAAKPLGDAELADTSGLAQSRALKAERLDLL